MVLIVEFKGIGIVNGALDLMVGNIGMFNGDTCGLNMIVKGVDGDGWALAMIGIVSGGVVG